MNNSVSEQNTPNPLEQIFDERLGRKLSNLEKACISEWLQQKQINNWLRGSLGYEIVNELLEELKS